jgi:hypothetical protein
VKSTFAKKFKYEKNNTYFSEALGGSGAVTLTLTLLIDTGVPNNYRTEYQ